MTRDDFLDAVLQVIKNDPRSLTGIKASALGNLILRALKEHWRAHGYWSLKEVLQELERTSLVRIGVDAQNALAVWLLEPPRARPSRATWFPLKKDIWIAFVSALPDGRRFMDRTSGAVRMALHESPQPIDQWAEIKRVADETQKGWAREFLQSIQQENGDLREALGDTAWYIKFPQSLKQANPDWGYRWNRFRSERVWDFVQTWCAESGVNPEITAQRTLRAEPIVAARGELTSDERVRHQVLAALGKMTTEELLQLAIPAKYWATETL